MLAHGRCFDNPQDPVVARAGPAAPVAVARGHVERAVGPGDDVAQPAVDAVHELLGLQDLPRIGRIEADADQPFADERREEEVALEVRQQVPPAERGSRRRHRRRVLEHRRDHPVAGGAVVDERPAVVLPGLDDVDLVAAARPVEARGAVLGLDLEPGPRIPVEALGIAVPVREHRRAGEGIVGGNRAVRVQAQRLAAERLQVLRDLAVRRVAGRGVQLAVRAEPEAAAGVVLRGRDALDEDRPLRERVAVVAQPHDADGRAPGRVVRVREVHQPGRRVVGGEREAHQPALALRLDVRNDVDRLRLEDAAQDDADAARALGHEQALGRRERHRPRHFETRDERLDAQRRPRLRRHVAGRRRRSGSAGRAQAVAASAAAARAAPARRSAFRRASGSGSRAASASQARRRWEMRSFSSGAISANVRSPPSGTKIVSQPNPPAPRGAPAIAPGVSPRAVTDLAAVDSTPIDADRRRARGRRNASSIARRSRPDAARSSRST